MAVAKIAAIGALVLSLAPFASAAQSAVTPTEKVIDLLKGLEATLQNESQTEAASYGVFVGFCSDKNQSLTVSISTGEQVIDSLTAEITEKTATKEDKSTQLMDAKTKLEELNTKLKDTELRAEKEKAEYQATEEDLAKAISSMELAIKAMKDSKPAATLLAIKNAGIKNPQLDEAMRVLDSASWTNGPAFLQVRETVDPSDPAYQYHSNDILKTLEELKEEYTVKKTQVDEEYAKAKAVTSELIQDTIAETGLTEESIETLENNIDVLTARVSEANQELTEAEAQLKDDQTYLAELTALCEKRAKEWEQRTAMRDQELAAIGKAIFLLEAKVLPSSAVSERALLQKQQPVSFLQHAVVQKHETQAVVQQQSIAHLQEQHKASALQLLGREGQRLGSSRLTALMWRASADPFAKIKTMIQQLIERLLKESTEEATKKGYCDKEMGQAANDRDFRWQEVQKLSAEIGELTSKQDELTLEMSDLSAKLEELAGIANETALQRTKDNEDNMHTLSEAKEGLEAVQEAKAILKAFYDKAARATALVQTRASPLDEENPGAGFDGEYGGNQAQSNGIIGMLEVIVSDFERTIRTTEAAEKEAAAEFVEFDQATKSEQAAKSKKYELDAEDLKKATADRQIAHNDMKKNMALVDSALSELEELKPLCVDNVMSYEERVAKREAEIAALKKTLCILDPEGVEEECFGES